MFVTGTTVGTYKWLPVRFSQPPPPTCPVLTQLVPGYGDITPSDDVQRAVVVVVIFLLLVALGTIVDACSTWQADLVEATVRARRAAIPRAVQDAPVDSGAAPIVPPPTAAASGEEPPPDPLSFAAEKTASAKRALRRSLLLIVALLVAGTVMFAIIEGWPFADGLWYCFITLTTIGTTPTTPRRDSYACSVIAHTHPCLPHVRIG